MRSASGADVWIVPPVGRFTLTRSDAAAAGITLALIITAKP
jgi:hypothetical protein